MIRAALLAPLAALGILVAFALGGNAATTAATWYVASNGNDTAACTQTAPCKTWDVAWDKAASGDTISVAAGTYPPQTITGNKTSETRIVADPGTTIAYSGSSPICGYSDGNLCANADWMTLENVTVDSGANHGQSDGAEINGAHVTFRNVNMVGPFVSVYPRGSYFTWQVGNIGRPGTVGGQRSCTNTDGQPIWVESSADHFTIDGVTIWPQDADPTPRSCQPGNGMHLEDIRIQGAQFPTVRNVVFKDDSGVAGNGDGSGHIFFTNFSSGFTLNGADIENNTFERVKGSYAWQTHTNVATGNGWTIKNNTFAQGTTDPGLMPGLVACGNTGPVPSSWQAACAAPPPPTTTATTTTAPTTTATTTTVPPPTCDAACEQAYKDQIAQLQADKAALQSKLDAITTWHNQYPG